MQITQHLVWALKPISRLGSRLQTFASIFLATLFLHSFVASAAYGETRTLRMYYTHSKESATITFKRNGKYIKSGLRKANRFLRDWRRKEPTKMDPALLDLVWEVYQASGSRKPIQVISGYRSPKTNNMLRRRGRKVARNSQHTRGKALDFFLPDVSVKKLRALGLKAHRGGVGYYRGSFVHLDTGRVRHWPRMSRRQLSKVFPKGRTIHVPSNGKPLRGYKTAQINLKRGRNADGSRRRTAVNKSLLARLFKEKEAKTKKAIAKKPVKKPALRTAKKPAAKKTRGADPFSVENSAVAKAKIKRLEQEKAKKLLAKKQEQEKQLALQQQKEKELELAAAQALEKAQKQREETRLAALNTVAVPKQRPVVKTPASTLTALAPDTANTAQKAATQLALAAPTESLANQAIGLPSLRPSVDIPQPETTASLQKSTPDIPTSDVNDLRSRVTAAIARNNATTNKINPNAQDTTQLASLTVETQQDTIATPSLRERLLASRTTASIAKQQQAKLNVPLPHRRQNNAPTNTKPAQPRIALNVPAPSKPSAAELQLGNLDGRSVRTWAIAHSTRVGRNAHLSAPNYKQGMKRIIPQSVYSTGFAFNASPLRADRFSGRALTRVAFAYLDR